MAMWKGILPAGASDLATIEAQMGVGKSRDRILIEGMAPRSEAAQRYVRIVEQLAPNEMLGKFQMQAPLNVQEAAKSTIMSILGQLPNYALDASLITTSTKLANLIYQMQMTGYMLKNAEYRISMTRALKGLPKILPESRVSVGNVTVSSRNAQVVFSGEAKMVTKAGESYVVDIAELTGALSQEVEDLRAELSLIRNSRENELRSNLLTYIQALPERELGKLTSDMDSSVTEAIEMLVAALMERLGIPPTGPEVVVQQSMSALSQLCYWQIVVGYRLRELEVLDRGVSLE